MGTITTVTCHIRGEDANAAYMVDVSDNADALIEAAKAEARENAETVFNDEGGSFGQPYRIWFTVASYEDKPEVLSTITATLPLLPDPEPVTATVS